jgi:acetolactate decarboxylase
MKQKIFFSLLCSVFCLQAGLLFGQKTEKQLFQFSTITALQEGIYDGELTLVELKKHGDFGVGTFDKLDGEMVVLNDTVYQVRTDGVPFALDLKNKIPFADVLFFYADTAYSYKDTLTLSSFQKILDASFSSINLIYAIRIDGVFKSVKVRSVPPQSKPYPRLIDAAKHQAVFEYENIKGTIVGFKLPKYMEGVGVSGYHLHFISADRKRGGHLLDCRIDDVKIQTEAVNKFELVLPQNSDFLNAKNIISNEKEIKKIEN